MSRHTSQVLSLIYYVLVGFVAARLAHLLVRSLMSESRPPTLDGERESVARGPLTLFEGQDLPRRATR
jgi:hypothetical protein